MENYNKKFYLDQIPPSDNMGVENTTTWHIDYLTITVWGSNIVELFNDYFMGTFPLLRDMGHGGRFYQQTYSTDLGIIVRYLPVGSDEIRGTIELPGLSCQYLGYDKLVHFYQYLCRTNNKVRIKRIDLAFDHCNFTVEDVRKCILSDDLRSYFKRSTIKIYECPRELDELGKLGTSGLTIGGRSSTRYMRVYDKHGYTRLELEFKAEKAEQVGIDVLMAGCKELAVYEVMGHIRDYIDFFSEWWKEFIADFDRLYKKLPESVKQLSTSQIKKWFENQVASAFYTLASLEGSEYFDNLYLLGSLKYKRSKFSGMVECYSQ